ncbi:unnamed protein product [Ascophyllum nodosum]
MTCPVCCVARRDFDLIEVEKPPVSRTRLKFSIFVYLPILLFCAAVSATLFAERVS